MKHTHSFAWSATTRPFGNARRGHRRLADAAAGIVAIAAVTASTLSGTMHQQAADEGDRAAARIEAEQASDLMRAALPTRETFIGGYIGAPYTYPSNVAVKKTGEHDFSVEGVEWDALPFKSPIYYGVRVIRWFEGGRTGAMLDFTHSKTISQLEQDAAFKGSLTKAPLPAQAKIGDVFRRLEFSHGHNMLSLNGLWRLGNLAPRLWPYIGAGVGVNLPHSEVQLKTAPGRTYEYQYTGPMLQGVIGIEFRVPRLSYFFEYKFSLAEYHVPLTHRDGSILPVDLWNQVTRWWAGTEPPGGFLTTRLTSHQVIGGLGVRIGAEVPAAP